jgi:hypothetical protein
MDMQLSAKEKTYSEAMTQEFNRMRKRGEFTDITLIFGGAKIPCHRMVVAWNCNYFKAMFLSGLKEKSAQDIEIQGIDAEIGEALVEYFYTGDLQITEDNAACLLATADMLLLEDLCSKVEDFLLRHVRDENCIEMLVLSARSAGRLQNLRSSFLHRLKDCFEEFSDKDLSPVCESDMLEIFNGPNDDYWADTDFGNCEETKFSFIQKWVRAKEGNSKIFPDLVKQVKLREVSHDFFYCRVHTEELMHTEDCVAYLEDAKVHMDLLEKTPPVVVVLSSGECWQLHLNAWQLLPLMPSSPPSLSRTAACWVPGGFVVCGGLSVHGTIGDVLMYKAATREWQKLPSLNHERYNHSVVYAHGSVFVFGGVWRSCLYLENVERYTFETARWSEAADVPKPALKRPYTAVVNDRLYVLGGSCFSEDSLEVYMYRELENAWDRKSDMPVRCRDGSCCALNSEIYLIDGHSDNCLRYDTEADQWTSMAAPGMQSPGAAVVMNEKMVALSRDCGMGEEFDPANGEWSRTGFVPCHRPEIGDSDDQQSAKEIVAAFSMRS